jgi:aspartyl-tRNA(Asn)/glutamyl-tRNA(Gln) amidotransferase subunit A
LRTTIGSAYYCDRVPHEDAVVVHLLNRAGAISLGKASLSEFATHPSGRNEFYGDVRNPLDIQRAAGGSSGGTAAAIAAGFCLGGTGTDTGGSIRIPASWCGIVGLRPTYGLVSRSGVHARAYSLDVCGPMAPDVTSCALLLDGMLARDTIANVEEPATAVYGKGLGDKVAKLRVGVIDDYTYRDVDSDVARGVQRASDAFKDLGAMVQVVQVPLLVCTLALEPLMRILLYEFNQILGAKYWQTEHRDVMFGQYVRDNLAAGTAVSAAVYEQAISERPRHIAAFREVFQSLDILLTPAVPMSAPLLETDDSKVWERTRRYTLPFSYLGVPAISIPVNDGGMPIGIQLVADQMQDRFLLRAAYQLEQALSPRAARA